MGRDMRNEPVIAVGESQEVLKLFEVGMCGPSSYGFYHVRVCLSTFSWCAVERWVRVGRGYTFQIKRQSSCFEKREHLLDMCKVCINILRVYDDVIYIHKVEFSNHWSQKRSHESLKCVRWISEGIHIVDSLWQTLSWARSLGSSLPASRVLKMVAPFSDSSISWAWGTHLMVFRDCVFRNRCKLFSYLHDR